MKHLHKILLTSFLLSISSNSLSMNVVAQFAWQKIAPSGFALLASYFAKMDNVPLSNDIQGKLNSLKNKVENPEPAILTRHVAQKFFLGPIYLQALNLTGQQSQYQAYLPPYQKVVNTNWINGETFNDALWQAYELFCQNDFRSGRVKLIRFIGQSPTKDDIILKLFKGFNAFAYNKHNILIKYEHDELWSALSEAKKIEIGSNKELRSAMNLELTLRHELLTKLQNELGLTNLDYKGLNSFLFSLMNLNAEQKFRTLLNLKPSEHLYSAFHGRNGILLKFNTIPYTLTNSKKSVHLKRMNELLFYNQDCQNGQLFSIASKAITAGLNGDCYYTHLAYGTLSPTRIQDFVSEVELIQKYVQAPKQKPQLPQAPQNNQDNSQDPENLDHIRLMLLLEALEDKALELKEIINTHLRNIGERFYINSFSLRHTIHGDYIKGSPPTGCHSFWGRCCFEIRRVKFWDINKHSICNIVKNGDIKQSSSMFPEHWPPMKIMDKALEWARTGTFKVIDSANVNGIRTITLTKNCCNDIIQFRAYVSNGIGDMEGLFPQTSNFINLYKSGIDCHCMK